VKNKSLAKAQRTQAYKGVLLGGFASWRENNLSQRRGEPKLSIFIIVRRNNDANPIHHTMKNTRTLVMLALALSILAGCKKDDDDDGNKLVGSFTFDGVKYEIYSENNEPTGAIMLFHDSGEGITEGSFTIAGATKEYAVTLGFAITYTTSAGISGTYTNEDLGPGSHTFSPWLSSYLKVNTSGTSSLNGNEPEGTLSIVKKSGNTYTLTFSFTYSDGTTASGNITQEYTVQEINM